jgi:general secretion pathway protein C
MSNNLAIARSRALPNAIGLILLLLLCACTAYWAMLLLPAKPAAVEMPIAAVVAPIDINQGATLFGGEGLATVSSSNFRLLGVLVARNTEESIALLSADDGRARPYRVNQEISSGVFVKEVHDKYAILSEGGALKRLALPERVPGRATAPPAQAVVAPSPLAGVPPAPPPEPEERPRKE